MAQRGIVRRITFEVDYPDGSQKTGVIEDATDVSFIAFDEESVRPGDVDLFNVSEEEWDRNPAMLVYDKAAARGHRVPTPVCMGCSPSDTGSPVRSIDTGAFEFLIGQVMRLQAGDLRNDVSRLEDQLAELKELHERLESRLTTIDNDSDYDEVSLWRAMMALARQAQQDARADKSARDVLANLHRHFVEFPWPPEDDG